MFATINGVLKQMGALYVDLYKEIVKMTFPQANQPQYMLLCFAFGYAFGAITFIFDLFNQIIKNGRLSQLVSGIRLILLALFFTIAKNHYEMGEIRLFMPTFTLVGYSVYLKTIGKIIAKRVIKLKLIN